MKPLIYHFFFTTTVKAFHSDRILVNSVTSFSYQTKIHQEAASILSCTHGTTYKILVVDREAIVSDQ